MPAAERKWIDFTDFSCENGSSQGQNLALTGLCVPSSHGRRRSDGMAGVWVVWAEGAMGNSDPGTTYTYTARVGTTYTARVGTAYTARVGTTYSGN